MKQGKGLLFFIHLLCSFLECVSFAPAVSHFGVLGLFWKTRLLRGFTLFYLFFIVNENFGNACTVPVDFWIGKLIWRLWEPVIRGHPSASWSACVDLVKSTLLVVSLTCEILFKIAENLVLSAVLKWFWDANLSSALRDKDLYGKLALSVVYSGENFCSFFVFLTWKISYSFCWLFCRCKWCWELAINQIVSDG